MNSEKIEAVVGMVIVVGMLLITTIALTEIGVVKRLSRESLEGYKGHATYKTNSVGEVTIEKLTWEKK